MEALESSWIVLVQAPFWAQVGIGWFALTAIIMVFGPVVNKIRYRRQFDALVREMGLEPTKDSDWPFTVRRTVEGRPFEIRDGWLDATLRAAVSDFLNHAPREGLIWVREGEVRYTMGRPWKGIDAQSIQALLKRHAALATALERTARGLL